MTIVCHCCKILVIVHCSNEANWLKRAGIMSKMLLYIEAEFIMLWCQILSSFLNWRKPGESSSFHKFMFFYRILVSTFWKVTNLFFMVKSKPSNMPFLWNRCCQRWIKFVVSQNTELLEWNKGSIGKKLSSIKELKLARMMKTVKWN